MHLALERLLAAWQPLRQLHVAELLQQIQDAIEQHPPGDATWVGSLQLPVLDSARLLAALTLALDDGRSTALGEAHAQAPRLAEAARAAQRPDHAKRLQAYADGAERLLAAGLLQSASTEAFRLTSTSDDVDVPGHVETILGETPMLAERDILAGMATGAINEGRYEVMDFLLGSRSSGLEAAAGDVAHIYALEILDKNTCAECAEVDGQEYFSMEAARRDYPGIGGGYVRCLGRTRCRGSLVIVYGDEAPPTRTRAVEPEPAPPPPPLPPPPPPPPPAPTPPPRPAGQTPNEFGIITPSPSRPDEFRVALRKNGDLLLRAYRDNMGDAQLEAFRTGARTNTREDLERGFREVLEAHGIRLAGIDDMDITPGAINSAGPPLDQLVKHASTFYPADWVAAANDRYDSLVFNDLGWDKRAFYRPGSFDRGIYLQSGEDLEVAVHEIGHHMEAILAGDLPEAEQRWLLARRKGNENAVSVPGYPKSEKMMLDELPEAYTGRIYGGDVERIERFYEVLTTGMQALAGARGYKWETVRADNDHMRFVLGILATIRP